MKNKLSKYRKLLVLMPLVFFFSFIIIHLISGTLKSGNSNKPSSDTLSNLNSTLPEPHIKEKEKTKLEAYMEMQADSLKKQTQIAPAEVKRFFDPGPPENDSIPIKAYYPTHPSLANREKRVNEQLNKILQQFNNPVSDNDTNNMELAPDNYKSSADINRMEQLLATLHADTAKDPEMQRLDGMLDKIIRIQNSELYNKNAIKKDSLPTLQVNVKPEQPTRSLIPVFFGLEASAVSLSKQKPAIRAVVHEDQIVQNGSTIKLRIVENTYIGGLEVPANTFIYGICSITDERLNIELDRLICNNAIYPIKLTAYDMDGIPGIHVPGAITRDATKEGLDRTMQTLTMTSLDPSLAAQATSAGIQSLKTLLSRKIKQVKVSVKAGHQLYLQ
jgi:hypothetical protein